MRPVYLLAGYPTRRRPRPRRVTVSRRAIIAGTLALAMLASWSVASVWYFMWRDEVALKLLERQATQKRLYDDQLAALRAKLEQASSERLVEQEALESQLKALLARQATLETRQAQIDELTVERTGSIEPRTAVPKHALTEPVEANAEPPAPSALDFFQLRLNPSTDQPTGRQGRIEGFKRDLDRVSSALSSLEVEQVQTLRALATEVEIDSLKLRGAIRRVGLDPSALAPAGTSIGGPLVPARLEGKPFETLLQDAQASLARLEHLRRSVKALPFAEPIRGEVDLSSGFGIRVDPFTRGPAMHTGLDIRAEHGVPVRATGIGRVVTAEFSGAYGNMIEIEHRNGVTSRYAHLSSIAVSIGQEIKVGTIIGRVGSTGRSTGPHLHYETRLNGEAVDPQRFLRAGASISAVVTASR